MQCCRHRRGRAEDDVGLRCDQFRRKSLRARFIGIGPTLLDPHIAAVDPSQPRQFLHECGEEGSLLGIALGETQERADTAQFLGLLRGRRRQPQGRRRSGCARQRRHEFASTHL